MLRVSQMQSRDVCCGCRHCSGRYHAGCSPILKPNMLKEQSKQQALLRMVRTAASDDQKALHPLRSLPSISRRRIRWGSSHRCR